MKPYATGFLLLLSLLSGDVRAQQENSPSPPERESEEQPVTLNGQRAFLGVSELPNSFSAGVGYASIFDDNPYFSTTDRHSNISQVIWPYVKVKHTTPRFSWDAGVSGMLVANQQLSTDNTSQESLELDLSYLPAPHFTLRLSSSLDNSSGLFSSFDSSAASGIGLVDQPSRPIFVPANQHAITTSNLVEVSDQISPHGVVGARGSYSLLNFVDTPRNSQFAPLYNNRSFSGEIFYNYQLSAKQWGGAILRTQKFVTDAQPNLTADSALLLYAISPKRPITLSFFAGPERFSIPVTPDMGTAGGFVQAQGWTPVAGATFVCKGAKIGVLGEFSRGINDGGGLSYAGVGETENAEFWLGSGIRRQLNLGFSHSSADLLLSRERFFDSLGRARFNQQLIGNLTAEIGYAREWQTNLVGPGTADANRVWVALFYGITRQLGK